MIVLSNFLHEAEIFTDRAIFDQLPQLDVQIFAQFREIAY